MRPAVKGSTKACNTCGETKPIEDFARSTGGTGIAIRAAICKVCSPVKENIPRG